MILPFTNLTVRSADDVLADLAACRQLRHLTDDERQAVVTSAFDELRRPAPYRALKHPSLDNLCDGCGKQRSIFSHGIGLCPSCYRHRAAMLITTVRVSAVFKIAIREHGFACDICSRATKPKEIEALERAVDHALNNLDGRVALMLCPKCTTLFKGFCSREFSRDATAINREDYGKLTLAYLAFEVRKIARRIHAQDKAGIGRANSDAVLRQHDDSTNRRRRRRQPRNSPTVSETAGTQDHPLRLWSANHAPGLVLGTVQEVAK